jgi:hypothetical protein
MWTMTRPATFAANAAVPRSSTASMAGPSASMSSATVARELAGMGVPSRRAEALATLMVSALEGAILMARAERSVRPLRAVARELGPYLDSCVAGED